MNSKEIVRHIRAILEKDTRINLHRHPISIATQNGDLILSGDVESVAAKKLTSWRRQRFMESSALSTGSKSRPQKKWKTRNSAIMFARC